MNQKNYITANGYRALQDELNDLVTKERPHLVKTVSWAAGNGDRSENGDYIYGKRRLREVDKRIHSLTKKLENAEIVESSVHAGSERVFFGAVVTIYRNDNLEQTVKIVGQDEINPQKNYISWTSPLARALLNKIIGDRFLLRVPSGTEWIEIIDVAYS
ncbi:MAG: transcription elongation factor GreB [Burkholderiales bacterium]|nr:transcription elongation factor GreB [Burkholderiales bacterium]